MLITLNKHRYVQENINLVAGFLPDQTEEASMKGVIETELRLFHPQTGRRDLANRCNPDSAV